ncbi:PASTA domain-containing protein [Streptococcus uberis]|uniref:PASTA domain-containing protein n=1 Tax=Streptococcus uberis TaxID=1349 RepID=UPI000DFBF36F|nr:PASTA domain-containing protein [Streptococcus uberis]SUO88514.1 PASTA domain [Streptococcus uberis]
MVNKKKNLLGKFGKVLDVLPNTTELIGDVVKQTVPIIDKSIDRMYDQKQGLVDLPNVTDLDIEEAKLLLEDLGFRATKILAKPAKKYCKRTANEVVQMDPKPGKKQSGSLVKLYYVSRDVIDASQRELDNLDKANVLIKKIPSLKKSK